MKFELDDKGTGTLTSVPYSNINYVNGTISLQPDVIVPLPKPNFTYTTTTAGDTTVKTGVYRNTTYVNYPTAYSDGAVTVEYATSATGTVQTYSYPYAVSFYLPASAQGSIVENSILINGAINAIVRNGNVYINESSGVLGAPIGTYDATTGMVSIKSPDVSLFATLRLSGLGEYISANVTDGASFIVPQSPILPSSVSITAQSIDGVTYNATCDNNGKIDAPFIYGKCDLDSGFCDVKFGNWETVTPAIEALDYYDANLVVNGKFFIPKQANAASIFFSAVGSKFIPVNTAVVGADVRRLPSDGKVPVFQVGDTAVLIYETTVGGTYTSSQVVNVGRTNVDRITAYDNLGIELPPAAVTSTSPGLGTITFGNLTGVSQPIQIVARDESSHLVTDVDISGQVSLYPAVTKAYPAGSLLCNALLMGDLFANMEFFFTQATWLNNWLKSREGANTTAQPNFTNYPIVLNNLDAINEDWAIIISGSTTTCNVIGRNIGQVLTNVSINQPIAPINPATGNPYFTIPALALGGGWSLGNVIRFKTTDASQGVSVIKTVSQGTRQSTDYKFCIETRIDVNS